MHSGAELRASWQIVGLLAAAVCLNYIDRVSLGVAAPQIVQELHLTATQLGILLSAFSWTYIPMQVFAGWLVERLGAVRVLTVGVALWAATTGLMSVATTFGALLALRLQLGIGESAFFPSSSKLIASEVELERRARANALLMFGLALGPAIGAAFGGRLMAAFGWRSMFMVFGCLSLLWLIPWSRIRPRPSPPAIQTAAAPGSPSFARILRERALWGAALGHLSLNYSFTFMLSWLPLYLVRERGFSLTATAGIAGTAFLLNAVSALASGWATDHWVRRGVAPNRIYKLIMASNHAGAMLVTVGAALAGPKIAIACLWLYQVLSGIAGPGVYAIGQTLAGPQAAGRWIGIQSMAANVAALSSPLITGWLVDATGTFVAAFILAASVNVLGLVSWLLVIRRIEPVEWGAPQPATA
jgi:MFS family permease